VSVDQHEQMIDRMLNRQIEARDLDELAQLSQTQPEALVRIAAALRGAAQVESGVEAAQALAETIELPATDDRESNRPSLVARDVGSWSGWATAAMVAAAWILAAMLNSTPPPPPPELTPSGGSTVLLTANEALEQYMRAGIDEGRIVQELPLLTVQIKPTLDGEESEVIYLRRFIERARIEGVYKMGFDEQGRAVVVLTDELPERVREAL